MGDLIVLLISSMLVSNVVLSRFLGICPFLGVSKTTETAAGMGIAVICVITLASAVTYGINHAFLLETGLLGIDLSYLQTIVFILVIAALVQFIEMVLKKYLHGLYEALGVYLPLITTNCAVLGVAITNADEGYSFAQSLIYGIGTSSGFCMSIILLAGINERIEFNDIPKSFKGKPIILITACLMAIAFTGFSGLI